MGTKRLSALLLVGLWLPGVVQAMSVAFVNPGKKDEIYWVTAARTMEAAARDLGIELEIIYAERQHYRSRDIALEIAARPPEKRPDYVIITNDYATGPELLRLFDGVGIRTFLAYSGISEAMDRQMTGKPRERYRSWLGSLEPKAEEAGYLTARALIEKGRQIKAYGADGKLHLLALSGDRSTPSSIRRNEGMRRAIAEAGDAVLDQEVQAAWNLDKAAEQSEWLFARHRDARLVWAGSDQMAFGAIRAWEKRGGVPGRDAWFSGINTSTQALESLRNGRLAALAGGHFIAGAWALVMLYDYDQGRDFAKEEGVELEQSMFTLFTPLTAEVYLKRYGDGKFDQIGFRRFSKVLNPKVRRYNFNFRQMLE